VKLLFLTPQLPHPPRQGTALRNWGLISHLATRGHEIGLLSFDDDGAEPSTELRRACARVRRVRVPQRSGGDRLRTLVASTLPDMAWRLWSLEFRDALVELLQEMRPDAVQVEGIELARYLFDERVAPLLTRVVFDDHNCEYLLQQRAFLSDLRRPLRWHGAAYSAVQSLRLRAFEQRVLQRADDVLCVSEQDRRVLSALAPTARVHVVCNGIDVADYAASAETAAPVAELADGESALVFTGKMDFRPNIDAALWFAREVLPEVARAVPNVKLLLVGQKPGVRLDALRADPRVCITGAVPHVQPYIGAASVYVAPLLAGGGTRFKLLEAMAMSRAVVSTRLGAEGFEVESGRELVLADAAREFAQAVIALLTDEQRRAALGARAREFVERSYDWSAIVPKLEEVYAAHRRPA